MSEIDENEIYEEQITEQEENDNSELLFDEPEIGDISLWDTFIFSTITIISVLMPIIFLNIIRGFLQKELLLAVERNTADYTHFINMYIVYFIIYKIFMVIVIVLFVIMLNAIAAKIFAYQVGKTILSIVIAFSLGIILYHIINYVILAFYDPFGFKEASTLVNLFTILGNLFSSGFEITDYTNYNSFSNLIFEFYYYFYFQQSGSLDRYFIVYLLGSGTYEGWVLFQYDYIFIILFSIPFFFIIFPRLTKKCQCTPFAGDIVKKSPKIHKRTIGETDISSFVENLEKTRSKFREI